MVPQNSNNSSIHTSFNPPLSPSSSSSPSPSSSSLSSTKLKTLLQTFLFSNVCHNVTRALAKAKSALIQLLKGLHCKNNKREKLFFGSSFRLHYNWGSTRSNSYVYYDSSWSSAVHKTATLDYVDEIMQECGDTELSKYLQWLEERGEEECCNEIDRLADLFIADCHEKFRLEKQESYRIFQEMING